MKGVGVGLIFFAVCMSAVFFYVRSQRSLSGEVRTYQEISIGQTSLTVVLSQTDQEITQGLSGRKQIGADGMLFVFPRALQPSFWMYQMQFPLDFIWIADLAAGQPSTVASGSAGSNLASGEAVVRGGVTQGPTRGRVVDLHENVAVSDPRQSDGITRVMPERPVRYVLELPAGWIKQHGISVGDEVVFHDRREEIMW